MSVRRWLGWPAVVLVTLVICDLILLAPLPTVPQSWAAVVVAILLPGLLLVNWILGIGTAVAVGERFVYSVGSGIALMVVLMLALSYLPGGLSFAEVALTFNALVVLLLIANLYTFRTSSLQFQLPALGWSLVTWEFVALAALLIGAAILRFTHIAYSELHGDEAVVALRANDVIQGWERALLIHKKGPSEILIATALYALTGQLTEYAAHLPFALASWTGVLAVYLLGKHWFGTVAGWWAGAMVAVDGYLMAFGRMLQYQTIVFLMTVLTVLAIERARQRDAHVQRYLLLAALFLATGLLAHYEGVLAIVPATVLLIALWQEEGANLAATKRVARWMAWPLLLCAAICVAFYVPYVLDPEFWRDTVYYVFMHRLGGEAAPEVFGTVVGRTTLYSSSYYFWTLVVLTLAGMVRGYRRYTPAWLQIPMILLLAGVMAELLIDSTAFLRDYEWLARSIFVVLFVPLWFGRGVPAPERAAWLWFGLPLMAVMFFIAQPGTHVYVFFIPWALVTGMVVQGLWKAVARRWGVRPTRYVLAPVMLLLTLIFGNYVYQLFVRNKPEILYTWDENRPAGYWTSFDTPIFMSIFGFPLDQGWKSVAALYAQGTLHGRFDSSVHYASVPDWYLRGEEYCGRDDPNYYMAVTFPLPWDRSEAEQVRKDIDSRYYLWGVVTAKGQPHLQIYAHRDRLAAEQEGSPRTFREEDFVDYYNENLLAPYTHNGPMGAQPIPNPSKVRFGDKINLAGHNVASQEVKPGGEVEVDLYWQATTPITNNYFVSIQAINLETTGKAGQRDGEPGCNRFQTSTWVAGDTIFDRYVVPIDAGVAPGQYTLLVKMYNDQGTLPVTNEDGTVSDGAIIGTVMVK